MRPVEKGNAPPVVFKKYQDAEPYLTERLGPYCLFCEMNISHVPEVEHREAKSKGGDLLNWENLLLGCKYCNTRKGTQVKQGDAPKYIWPDTDDTFHAFSYDGDIPRLNEAYDGDRNKAQRLYELVGLGNIPVKPSDKDKRYRVRSETRNCALRSLQAWKRIKEKPEKEEYLQTIIDLATAKGFFSTWMEIFKNEEEVTERLMDAFAGTNKKFCGKCDTYIFRQTDSERKQITKEENP